MTIQQMKNTFKSQGEHYVGVIRPMPGLTSVELVEQGSDFVTIRTNEGHMKCTCISKRVDAESFIMEFDEEYQAGTKVTTNSHFLDDFTTSDSGVKHRTAITRSVQSTPPDGDT